MDPEISHLSREYLLVPVTMTAGGVTVDPAAAGFGVELALVGPDSEPAPDGWATGDWERDAAGGWNARCLIGPGAGLAPGPGIYEPWVRITADPEMPVRRAPGWVRVV